MNIWSYDPIMLDWTRGMVSMVSMVDRTEAREKHRERAEEVGPR